MVDAHEPLIEAARALGTPTYIDCIYRLGLHALYVRYDDGRRCFITRSHPSNVEIRESSTGIVSAIVSGGSARVDWMPT